jgi:glycosyltransferase involved in cell wall biosynthesis
VPADELASPAADPPHLRILGTHGVPAAYGGFETAAENIALHLVARGWRVTVYCQLRGRGAWIEDSWRGIARIGIPVEREGWHGTTMFDWLSIRHACRQPDLCLTFGYNTAIFNLAQRLRGIPNVINMDGMEWSRKRWGWAKQAILYANERIGCRIGQALIADHPVIAEYLETRAEPRRIRTIAYGADAVEQADPGPVHTLGLAPGSYLTLVARLIPENQVLELVRTFSQRPRGVRLVVVGGFEPADDPYHCDLAAAAADEVLFTGPIYDRERIAPLRFHGLGYLHGHTVGGTNPSLVEAMAAGNPVIAHDNVYNRWVAGDAALYFRDPASLSASLDRLISDGALRERLGSAARRRHAEHFTWEHIADQYDTLLREHLPAPKHAAALTRTGAA